MLAADPQKLWSRPALDLASVLVNIPPWMEHGRCIDADPDAFFPEKDETTKPAKRICGTCDVRDECLSWALAEGLDVGVFGGLSGRERRALSHITAA